MSTKKEGNCFITRLFLNVKNALFFGNVKNSSLSCPFRENRCKSVFQKHLSHFTDSVEMIIALIGIFCNPVYQRPYEGWNVWISNQQLSAIL